MRNKFNIIILAFTFLIISKTYGQVEAPVIEKTEPQFKYEGHEPKIALDSSDEIRNFHTVSEINKNKFLYGTYHTKGYVVKVYKCPSSNEKINNKHCEHDQIIISEEIKIINDDYKLTEKDLLITLNQKENFEVGKECNFLIQVLCSRSLNRDCNDIKLIYFEKIKVEEVLPLEPEVKENDVKEETLSEDKELKGNSKEGFQPSENVY